MLPRPGWRRGRAAPPRRGRCAAARPARARPAAGVRADGRRQPADRRGGAAAGGGHPHRPRRGRPDPGAAAPQHGRGGARIRDARRWRPGSTRTACAPRATRSAPRSTTWCSARRGAAASSWVDAEPDQHLPQRGHRRRALLRHPGADAEGSRPPCRGDRADVSVRLARLRGALSRHAARQRGAHRAARRPLSHASASAAASSSASCRRNGAASTPAAGSWAGVCRCG